jgi:hypothetical protein
VARRGAGRAKTATQHFELFLEQADRLAGRRLMKTGLDTSLTITAGSGPAMVTWKKPDDEDFQAFLVDLRPFLSPGEPVFLERIHNLIEQHVTDPALREEARRSRKILRDVEAGADLAVEWERLDNRRASRLSVRREVPPSPPFEENQELKAWATSTMVRMTDLLRPMVKAL